MNPDSHVLRGPARRDPACRVSARTLAAGVDPIQPPRETHRHRYRTHRNIPEAGPVLPSGRCVHRRRHPFARADRSPRSLGWLHEGLKPPPFPASLCHSGSAVCFKTHHAALWMRAAAVVVGNRFDISMTHEELGAGQATGHHHEVPFIRNQIGQLHLDPSAWIARSVVNPGTVEPTCTRPRSGSVHLVRGFDRPVPRARSGGESGFTMPSVAGPASSWATRAGL